VIRVLGIDPGTLVCGYGVIESADGAAAASYVECGVIAPRADWPMERRLAAIARGLRDVIDELAPDVIAMEAVFAHLNPRSALSLAQGRGMALAVAGLSDKPVFSYAPALVKKTVVGRGRATKEQVARMVASLVGLRTAPTADAADALAVAITHARTCTRPATRVVSSILAPAKARAATRAGPETPQRRTESERVQ
jgi:crossover junction endodeoxyribonuclease RuvC